MNTEFKDHFSDKSQAYSAYRPGYPEELFSYLSSITEDHDRAWDCGTGSGQSAIALSQYYSEVVATDASENQINNAIRKEGVTYKIESAENTSMDSGSVDLVTVAQALHWFNIDNFAKEVNRVLKPRGVLAVWTYGLLDITPQINEVINDLYGPMLDQFWPPERKVVEQGYKNVELPLQEIQPPHIQMETTWELEQFIGYLRTWSAVKKYEAALGVNPVDMKYEQLSALWGDPEHKRMINWPLTLRVWRKHA